jgi:hypothetical protein
MTTYRKDSTGTPLPDEFNNITPSRRSNFSEGAQGADSNWGALQSFAEDNHDLGYFVPGLGTGMLVMDSKRDFEKGDWAGGLINAGLAAVNVLPFGSVVSGIGKGIRAAATAGTKTAAKVLPKSSKSQYPNLKKFNPNKPIKVKDIDPNAKGVKGLPKAPKGAGKGNTGGVLKPKGTKGSFAKGALGGYLLNDALDAAAGGVGGITDRELAGAVTRTAAFQAGASR